jgi:class 3 adenylate cyclase/tetratricopeptide (TPR) repeat protein/ABC-type transport system involved in cytochrome c biogenesis ATPase subunit
VHDIKSWLAGLGLEKYVSAFTEAEISFSNLPDLTEEDLKELGLPLGPRRTFSAAIKGLDAPPAPPALSLAEPIGNSSPAAPPITETEPTSDAERRHLTVMFVDLVGSTEMATRIDAEDMREVINGYQNTVAGVVSRFEGFVAKFMGDGVLCYFGWPRANEDDAERAVRAGLSIIEAVKKTKAPNGSPLATRIGIATGVVIVGDMIGSGATQEAAVVGETPNLAARLQGVAQPNQLVLPQETRRLLGNTYKLTSIGAQDLKGVGAPVEAFVVEGEAALESRFAARQSGTLTPIVGREREIELMLERWAMARARKGQMVIVSGEAGIGKSRITQAVIDAVARDEHVRMTYQCSPYHADSAFYPVTQQMAFAAGFAPSDSADARLDKLEALLGTDHDTLKLVAPLMGLDGTTRYGALDFTPTQQRAQTMQALARLLVQQSQKKPVLLVYEDLHWIDPTSLELVETLLDATADQPIMILATARPTFEYGFGGHPIVTRFALNRLGKDQISDIVSKLTGGKALPEEIMEIIAQRTDGVPLFVEELTKTILETGALKEAGDQLVLNGPLSAIAIPATLHDSLMARLDRLQPIKEVAQTAACIGREFSHRLLARIARLSEVELAAALDGLIGAELIYRRGLPPEAVYLFKHALVRDAAYESLLKEKRRAIHARILAALENDPDVAPEVLAVHAEAANLTDRAIDLWELAGQTAIARPAFREGISNLHRAIALITSQLEIGDNTILNRALSLQVRLGYASIAHFGWGNNQTKAAFEHALVLADRVGETPLRFQILYGLMTNRYIRGDHAEAVHHGQVLVNLAEKMTETAPAVVANRSFACSLMFTGEFERAQPYYDRALGLFDPVLHNNLAHLYGTDLGIGSHALICWNLLIRGESRRAEQLFHDCERYGLACTDVASNCYRHMIGTVIHLLTRNGAEFERHTNSLVDMAGEHNLVYFANYAALNREFLQIRNGDVTGIASFSRTDAAIVATKALAFLPLLRTEIAYHALTLGLRDEAVQLATTTQGLIDQTGEKMWLSGLHRLYAAIAKADGDNKTAERHLTTALDVARQQGAKLFELRAANDLARLLQNQSRIEEAVAVLNPIHNSIAEGDCPEDQATARELLAELAG